jgi:hypothetical protein
LLSCVLDPLSQRERQTARCDELKVSATIPIKCERLGRVLNFDGALMSQSEPRARKGAQRDADPSSKRFDDAIGSLWLTPEARGPLALMVRRKALQTIEVCGGLAPANSTTGLASMRHPN